MQQKAKSRPIKELLEPAPVERPTREQAEAAVKTLLTWAGDNPERDGLHETPARVAKAFEEWFRGYKDNPEEILKKTFEETEGYDEMIVLRGIPFESHCEHHLAPIIGKAWVAYIPRDRVVGISKLARVVDAYSKRLQIQEKMTAQIANVIQDVLNPEGVGVVIKGVHHCMTTRGVHKNGVDMVTSRIAASHFRQEPTHRPKRRHCCRCATRSPEPYCVGKNRLTLPSQSHRGLVSVSAYG